MVDVPKQIEAVTRALRTEEVDGAPAHVQTLVQEYPAGIDDVWDAATSAERIARWFLPVSGELRLGGRYQLEGNAGGEVLACSPPADGAAEYRVTWEMGGGVTWLAVRLTADGPDRTRFELEHTARTADVPAEMWEMFGPGATGVGWDGGLLWLSLHLGAVPGSLAPEEAAAWAVTDEGRAFYRAAADGWAAAHIAAGADPETARRNADATYGFYTGQMAGGE
ncbi:MAG: SRPBCC domain-containing protein [Leucobacter sp.]